MSRVGDYYRGKVRCEHCHGTGLITYQHPKWGEYEEQCWFCGCTGWVEKDGQELGGRTSSTQKG